MKLNLGWKDACMTSVPQMVRVSCGKYSAGDCGKSVLPAKRRSNPYGESNG
ncbi:MAG: hypothetical protein IJD43_11185 [Thermoguttaceae bacterium]|nr:hypothetical protein [Thermoguttaceae bacterium]